MAYYPGATTGGGAPGSEFYPMSLMDYTPPEAMEGIPLEYQPWLQPDHMPDSLWNYQAPTLDEWSTTPRNWDWALKDTSAKKDDDDDDDDDGKKDGITPVGGVTSVHWPDYDPGDPTQWHPPTGGGFVLNPDDPADPFMQWTKWTHQQNQAANAANWTNPDTAGTVVGRAPPPGFVEGVGRAPRTTVTDNARIKAAAEASRARQAAAEEKTRKDALKQRAKDAEAQRIWAVHENMMKSQRAKNDADRAKALGYTAGTGGGLLWT